VRLSLSSIEQPGDQEMLRRAYLRAIKHLEANKNLEKADVAMYCELAF